MTDSGKIRLVTRGDDLGSFQSANLAIIDAYKRGLLRNTSVMVPTPCFEHSVAMLREVPDLCVGLHVTLTSEWDAPRWGPVLPPEQVPSLVDDDGCFLRTPHQLFERGFSFDEAVREAEAQLSVARAHGLNIRYMDEHMGVGWIFDQNVGQKERLMDRLRALAVREGLLWHLDHATFLPNSTNGSSVRDRFQHTLNQVQPGAYVLVTHPAYDGEDMRALSHIGVASERLTDYQLLCDPEFALFLQERNIEVVRYDQV